MTFSQRNSPLADAGEHRWEVPPLSVGKRLDRWLAESVSEISRSRIQAAIRSGAVLLNGASAKASEIVRTGDKVLWRTSLPLPCESARAEGHAD
jgi:Pseudouridylate synthases, 23S RNA-specific